jgi:hypothetical protein
MAHGCAPLKRVLSGMISQPKLGLFILIAFALAITLAVPLDLPGALYWRIAPERYLMGAHGFYGQHLISDEMVSDSYAPVPLLAWRRLAAAGDTAAFRRLLASGTPAGKVYGLAGLEALAPLGVGGHAISPSASAESLFVNAECREGRVSLREALLSVGTPEQARRLLGTPTVCR